MKTGVSGVPGNPEADFGSESLGGSVPEIQPIGASIISQWEICEICQAKLSDRYFETYLGAGLRPNRVC